METLKFYNPFLTIYLRYKDKRLRFFFLRMLSSRTFIVNLAYNMSPNA